MQKYSYIFTAALILLSSGARARTILIAPGDTGAPEEEDFQPNKKIAGRNVVGKTIVGRKMVETKTLDGSGDFFSCVDEYLFGHCPDEAKDMEENCGNGLFRAACKAQYRQSYKDAVENKKECDKANRADAERVCAAAHKVENLTPDQKVCINNHMITCDCDTGSGDFDRCYRRCEINARDECAAQVL